MEKKSIFPPNYDSEVTRGTAIVNVSDKRLAACLIAVGIRLRKDPPYTRVRRLDGSIHTTFHFLPACDEGELKTADMVRAWGQDLDFIDKNPLHPFTFAMCAIRNYQQILEHMKKAKPYVAFRVKRNGKPATLLVKEGSKKYEAAKKRGYRQV